MKEAFEDNHDKKILITNIQRFSLHDGPGIRTTVFMKGCSLHCPWCCNPENLTSDIQYVKGELNKTYGHYLTCDELFKEIIKDRVYYSGVLKEFDIDNSEDLERLPGGVTFSGGEALLQIHAYEELLKRLNSIKLHTAIESSLFVHSELLELALKYIDLFYVDIKILDKDCCKKVLQGDLDLYLNNLDLLFDYRNGNGKHKPVVFRIPVIGGYTDNEINREAIVELIQKYSPIKVELIIGHNLGDSKYKELGMNVPEYVNVSDDFIQEYLQKIKNTGTPAEICSI